MNDRIPFFDFKSQQVTYIDKSDICPGTMQVQIPGVGVVWINSSDVSPGPIRHAEFSEEVRDLIRHIQDTFAEHIDMSFDEWEMGFRRDMNPESEIAIWLRASHAYRHALQTKQRTFTARRDIYKLLVARLTSPRDNVFNVVNLDELSECDSEDILDVYEGGVAPE